MNKIAKYLLTLISILSVMVFFTQSALAWDDCPYGKVNDEYPGDCARYIDTDNDGICDHSQPAPGDRIAVEAETDNYQLVADTGTNISTNNSDSLVGSEEIPKQPSVTSRQYYFFPITIVLIVAYLISYLLQKFKKIKIITHQRLWNIILLFSFLGSALLGILLVFNISLGTTITLPFNMLFWHVEFGLAMVIIAIFHIWNHRRYFTAIIRLIIKPRSLL
jgi:hypothetical protein